MMLFSGGIACGFRDNKEADAYSRESHDQFDRSSPEGESNLDRISEMFCGERMVI